MFLFYGVLNVTFYCVYPVHLLGFFVVGVLFPVGPAHGSGASLASNCVLLTIAGSCDVLEVILWHAQHLSRGMRAGGSAQVRNRPPTYTVGEFAID